MNSLQEWISQSTNKDREKVLFKSGSESDVNES